jgi:predicted dehydrogenase
LWFVEHELAGAAEPKKFPGPNDRPAVALLGCGGAGTRDAMNAANNGEVVAVCDVDSRQAAKTAEKLAVDGKVPTLYSDFRRLLERDEIQALVNATPDHWHTRVNLGAAQAQMDIYAEKPLTLTIEEGRRLVKSVQRSGIVLQTGTQQRSSSRFRLACELVRNGRIGTLKTASVWLRAGLREGPFTSAPVPEGLNWDYWLGQAPRVEYVPQRCHQKFRFWYDYSVGTMTDWGAHHNDIAYWAIGLLAPREVSSYILAQPIPGGYDTFSEYEVNYTYRAGGNLRVRGLESSRRHAAHDGGTAAFSVSEWRTDVVHGRHGMGLCDGQCRRVSARLTWAETGIRRPFCRTTRRMARGQIRSGRCDVFLVAWSIGSSSRMTN